jgi:hypothetical protein
MNTTILSSLDDRIREAVDTLVQDELDRLGADGRHVIQIEFPLNGEAGELFLIGEYLTPVSDYDIGRKFMINAPRAADSKRLHPFDMASPGDVVKWRTQGNRWDKFLFHGRFEWIGSYRNRDGRSTAILAAAN